MAVAKVTFVGTASDGNEWLYDTDGTSAGTTALLNLDSLSGEVGGFNTQAFYGSYQVANVALLLVVYPSDGASGSSTAFIVADSTTADPTPVVLPNSESLAVYGQSYAALVNGRIVIGADDTSSGGIGDNLTVSDGTQGGTYQLVPPTLPANEQFTLGTGIYSLGTIAVFGASGVAANGNGDNYLSTNELYVTNGTSAGTEQLAPPAAPPDRGLDPQQITVFGPSGDEAAFIGIDAAGDDAVWVTNGTENGTFQLAAAGLRNANLDASGGLAAFGNGILFGASDSSGGNDIWYSDGTDAGTRFVASVQVPDDLGYSPFFVFGSRAFFFAGTLGNNLWVTDGTSAGTQPLTFTTLVQPINFDNMVALGNKAVFAGAAMATEGDGPSDLWVSDGTAAGTTLLQPAGADSSGLFPTNLYSDGTHVYFNGLDANGLQQLWVTDGTLAGTQELTDAAFGTDLDPSDFASLAADGPLPTPCYGAGTRIATPGGDVAIEALKAGDLVLTLGGAKLTPRHVVWVGSFTVHPHRHPRPAEVAPVCIRAHAFAPNVPTRDLIVSPNHAVLWQGGLIHARSLINGTTIAQIAKRRVTYVHVELDAHHILLAEGLPAESYLDTGNRAHFSGEAGARPLHPDLATVSAWDARCCAKLHLDGPHVVAARAALNARAATMGLHPRYAAVLPG